MRFALIATCAAAVVAVPLAVQASGPQMTQNEFLSAVRCAAYQGADADARYQLNTEARHQSPAVAAEARQIALQAVNGAEDGNGAMVEAESAACAGAALIAGAHAQSAA